jgi:hypothetical protein
MASWHEVADTVSNRLYYHAFNCPIADSSGGHVLDGQTIILVSDEDKKTHVRAECPFCMDTDAYKMYSRKKATNG